MVCHAAGWSIALGGGILLPSISAEFDLSFIRQGLLSSVPVWTNVAFTIPLSMWLLRYRPTIITTVTLVLGLLFLLIQASAPLFVILMISRLAFGMTIAAREPARTLLMQQWFTSREFIMVNGVTAGLLSVVFSVTLLLTPFLLKAFSNDWRATFYLFAGVFAVLAILWPIIARERIAQEYQLRFMSMDPPVLLGLLKRKTLWMAGFAFLGAHLSASCFFGFYPTLMLNRYDVALEYSGIIMALSLLAGGIISFVIGKVTTDWKTRSRLLYAFGIFMLCSYLILIATDSLTFLLLGALLNGLSWGFFPIILTVTFSLPNVRAREVPVGHAFLFTMVTLGLALGPIIAGLLQDAMDNLVLVFLIMSIPSLSIVVSGFFVRNLQNFQIQKMGMEDAA
jgi:MFS family permease